MPVQIRYVRTSPHTYILHPVGTSTNAAVLVNHFFRLFPQVSRRAVLGCVAADSSVLASLGFATPQHEEVAV
jgi:hypothetical protein